MQTLPFLEKLIHYLSKENILECVRACVMADGRRAVFEGVRVTVVQGRGVAVGLTYTSRRRSTVKSTLDTRLEMLMSEASKAAVRQLLF